MIDVDVTVLHQRFMDSNVGFQQRLDAIKMALVLFAEAFLLGRTT